MHLNCYCSFTFSFIHCICVRFGSFNPSILLFYYCCYCAAGGDGGGSATNKTSLFLFVVLILLHWLIKIYNLENTKTIPMVSFQTTTTTTTTIIIINTIYINGDGNLCTQISKSLSILIRFKKKNK